MSSIIFHPDVALEVKSSYLWYEAQVAGLGHDYLSELESAYQAIETLPKTWPKFKKQFRRFLLSKFPYSVIYRLANNTVYVVAVMHNHRNPDYWEDRA
jgi:toxin ParE1/3/4